MNVASAQIDHTKLKAGLWLQEERMVGQTKLYVYDLRFLEPFGINKGELEPLNGAVIHTIEHLLAYYLRQDGMELFIVSVFPYGCRTGFGVISTLDIEMFYDLLCKTLSYIIREVQEVPFANHVLCGNYRYFDLPTALDVLRDYFKVIGLQKQFYPPRV